jgi:UDP-GlcNAc:undecaprenyl-phosphate/decaprenyl-phosphate GlcNAc-1-phosphate transferase
MLNHVLISGVAFTTTLAALPLAALLGRRMGAWDSAEELGMHAAPVARSGGIAIMLGIVLSLEILKLLPGAGFPARPSAALTIGTLAFFLVGLLDDLHEIKPYLKATGLVLAALLFTMLSPYYRVAGFERLDVLLAVAVLVGGANALNFMDGMDGLAAGMAAIAAAGFFVMAHLSGLEPECDWALALAGAGIAFWLVNKPPARIFMGDCGSLLLGFGLSVLLLAVGDRSPRRLLAGAVILFPLILDAGLAIVRRAVLRRDIFSGDRRHSYDLLFLRYRSVWRTDLMMYALGLVFAALGIGSLFVPLAVTLAAGLALSSAFVWWLTALGMFAPANGAARGAP